MPFFTYPYELPPMKYAYDALEPYINAEVMHYHYDKHFNAYITNLNKALAPYPELQKLKLNQLLRNPGLLPAEAYLPIMRNAGGVYNHSMYFNFFAPPTKAKHEPAGYLAELIDDSFGSFENFKARFTSLALSVFGSGWAFLALTPDNELKALSLKNQETPLSYNLRPIMFFDVWEHAYYLQYKNDRAEYVKALWNIVVFPDIEQPAFG